MKKFSICLAILAVFGIFIFFVGWTSIRIKPEYVGVVTSKTGGVSEEPVINGKFSWYKEFLLPTNAVLNSYSINPVTVTKTVKGSLASGDIYSSIFGSSNNFSYEFTYTLSLSVSEENLISLIKENKVKTQADLDNYLSSAGDIIAQLTTNYILKKVQENSNFQIESIRREDLTKGIRFYEECPEVDLSLFAITSSKIPDYELYNKVRGQVFSGNFTSSSSENSSGSSLEQIDSTENNKAQEL